MKKTIILDHSGNKRPISFISLLSFKVNIPGVGCFVGPLAVVRLATVVTRANSLGHPIAEAATDPECWSRILHFCRSQNSLKNRFRTHFIFGSIRSLRGLNKKEKTLRQDVNFGCADGFWSSNRSRILKFWEPLDSVQDSKNLEQERSWSLKM